MTESGPGVVVLGEGGAGRSVVDAGDHDAEIFGRLAADGAGRSEPRAPSRASRTRSVSPSLAEFRGEQAAALGHRGRGGGRHCAEHLRIDRIDRPVRRGGAGRRRVGR